MKKFSFTKIIALPIVFGLLIGFFIIESGIDIMSYIVPILMFLVIFIILVSVYIMLKESNKQLFMLNQGKYDELIEYMANKHEQFNGQIGYKQQYLVGIANCYSRKGQFQASLNYLEKIEESKMDNKMKAGYYALYSSNLYFLNQDINKAEELIINSRKLQDMPESMLLNSLIDMELGKREKADELIEQYHKLGNRKKYLLGAFTILIIDEFTTEVSEKFMLGLYYKRVGEQEKSRKCFLKAADCDYWNYFSDLSREMCQY